MRAIVAIVTIGFALADSTATVAQDIPAPAQLPPVSAAAQQGWHLLAHSRAGRAIEFAQFGLGPEKHRVLVIGPLAGNQPAGIALADKLASHCRSSGDGLGNLAVTIVRDPNPDGRAKFQAANGGDVDLNRNFHTTNWQREIRAGRSLSGTAAGSEPETKAVVRAMDEFRPDQIIVLRASGQPGIGCLDADQPLAGQFADATGLPVHEPTAAAGSLFQYAAVELSIPTFVVDVPDVPASRLWKELGPALLGLMGTPPPVTSAPAEATASVPQVTAPREATPAPASSKPKAQPVSAPPRTQHIEPEPELAPLAPARPLAKVNLPEDRKANDNVVPWPPRVAPPAGTPRSLPWPATRIERTSPKGY